MSGTCCGEASLNDPLQVSKDPYRSLQEHSTKPKYCIQFSLFTTTIPAASHRKFTTTKDSSSKANDALLRPLK
ncbi:hypothetical protein ACA910_013016 [Epithemia clementina (nom. ined.)]